MSRVQLALNVSDLDAAVAFYSKMFSIEPAMRSGRPFALRIARPRWRYHPHSGSPRALSTRTSSERSMSSRRTASCFWSWSM